MSLAILFNFLCAQHVSDINIPIIRSLRLCCWVLVLQDSACKTSTTQQEPHQISNTQRTENKTTDVVIQQHSRKLLMMGILMSETCWAHNTWNRIASDIKLVFHSSAVQRKTCQHWVACFLWRWLQSRSGYWCWKFVQASKGTLLYVIQQKVYKNLEAISSGNS